MPPHGAPKHTPPPHPPGPDSKAQRRRRRDEDSPRYVRYRQHCQSISERRQKRLAALRAAQTNEVQALRNRYRQRDAYVVALLPSRAARDIYFASSRRKLQQELQRVQRRYRQERKAVWQTHRAPRWFDWLREQAAAGDQEALETLRERCTRDIRAGTRPAGKARPAPNSSPAGSHTLYQQYLRERDAWHESQAEMHADRRAAYEDLRHRSLRRAMLAGWFIRSRLGRQLWNQLQRRWEAKERQRIETLFNARAQREGIRQGFESWSQWLHRQAAFGNPNAQTRSPTPFASVEAVADTGTVVYRVPGGLVRDDGESLALSSATNLAAAEAFLHLAYAKFGSSFNVDGTEEFRRQVVYAAALTNLPITFLNPELEAQRTALTKEMHSGSRRKQRRHQPLHGRYHKPNAANARDGQPLSTVHDLPNMPPCAVVRDRQPDSVFLQSHAQPDLRQQQSQNPRPTRNLRRRPRRTTAIDKEQHNNRPKRRGRGRRQ